MMDIPASKWKIVLCIKSDDDANEAHIYTRLQVTFSYFTNLMYYLCGIGITKITIALFINPSGAVA